MNYKLNFRVCTRPKWAQIIREFIFSEMHMTGAEAKLLWPRARLDNDTLYEIEIKIL